MFSTRRSVAIILVGAILGVVVIYEVMRPVRTQLAARYVERGDQYLQKRDYDLAIEEYDKALKLNADDAAAIERKELAEQGPTDISVLRDFFEERGESETVAAIDAAAVSFDDPKAAAEAGLSLYASHEYALAKLPLEQAVALDPGYPEAWHYLALTYQELASFDASYRSRADEAFGMRDSLTSKYLE